MARRGVAPICRSDTNVPLALRRSRRELFVEALNRKVLARDVQRHRPRLDQIHDRSRGTPVHSLLDADFSFSMGADRLSRPTYEREGRDGNFELAIERSRASSVIATRKGRLLFHRCDDELRGTPVQRT